MKEMHENRDSVILRVELSRENGGINTKVSYIPCLSEDTPSGAAVVTAYPPHSDASRESFLRTKEALGKSINHFKYRPTVMFSGSSILNDIFKTGSGFRLDKTAMYLSQISLGSEKSFDPPEDCDDVMKLEFGKDLVGYIKSTSPDFWQLIFIRLPVYLVIK